MKYQKINKKIYWIGGAFLLVLLIGVSYAIKQRNEYPIEICSSTGCLRAKKVNFNERCISTERNEIICGDFILRVKKGIEVNNNK